VKKILLGILIFAVIIVGCYFVFTRIPGNLSGPLVEIAPWLHINTYSPDEYTYVIKPKTTIDQLIAGLPTVKDNSFYIKGHILLKDKSENTASQLKILEDYYRPSRVFVGFPITGVSGELIATFDASSKTLDEIKEVVTKIKQSSSVIDVYFDNGNVKVISGDQNEAKSKFINSNLFISFDNTITNNAHLD